MMQADNARDGKRRRHHGIEDDSCTSKKQAIWRAASPVEHLSCARIRLFVHASRPKATEETRVVRDDAQEVITKQNTGDSTSCKKIQPEMPPSRPKKETSSSTLSARAVRDGVIKKEKAGQKVSCTRFGPAVAAQASSTKDKLKAAGAGVLRNDAHGVIKSKQDASRSVQATVTKSVPQIHPAAPAANHPDPFAAQDALRAALAVAHQVRQRRQNVYRQQRKEARRDLDKVVRTVFFNDPSLTLERVLLKL
jgi:hypothetical protein